MGRRHCQTEVKRLLGLTNGMWVIGEKKGQKQEENFEFMCRFYTDAFKENKLAMESAQSQINTQYDKIKITPAVNMEKPKFVSRQKSFAIKSIESGKLDLGKLLLIESASNVNEEEKELEELGVTPYLEISEGGQKIVLFHYRMVVMEWESSRVLGSAWPQSR